MNPQQPPPAGWGAQPIGQVPGQPPAQQPFPQQFSQPQQVPPQVSPPPSQQPFPTQAAAPQQAQAPFPQQTAPPSGFSTAPPAGFGAPATGFGAPPASPPLPQQTGPQAGYVTTAPPLQVVQPTPHVTQQGPSVPPQAPPQPQAAPQAPPQQMDLFQQSAPQTATAAPQQTLPTAGPILAGTELPADAAGVVTAPAPAAVETGPSVQSMLRAFAKQPGCDRFSGDAEKVKLLEEYIWCRQLMPNLDFELFLQLYTPLADFDAENCKHPADAIKKFLPRSKKQADATGAHQWSAKEIVDYVALYVDIIREAEQTHQPLSMTFVQFVQNQQLLTNFHQGLFKEAPQPKAAGTRKGTSAPKTQEKVRPSAAGQRSIYTAQSGRQFRGVLTNYWQDPQSLHVFADFRADSGEEFNGLGINHFEICEDPSPNPPQTNDGTPLPELGRAKLTIPKAQYPSVLQALALSVPVGTVPPGDILYSFNHPYQDGYVAVLDVVNGETGPYVDACLCRNSRQNVVAENNPPRKNIVGLYTFEVAEGSFLLEVTGNQ